MMNVIDRDDRRPQPKQKQLPSHPDQQDPTSILSSEKTTPANRFTETEATAAPAGRRSAAMDPSPQPPPVSAASDPGSPYSVLDPLLLHSPKPHLLFKPKTLTHSLSSSSSSSLASMDSSSPTAPTADAWELLTATTPPVSHVDGGLDDFAIFPPRLHEGLGLEGEPEEAVAPAAAKEAEEEEDAEWLWGAWGWRWETCRLAARRAWAAGVGAVQDRVLMHGACGCTAVRPAVWSAVAAAAVVGALLYARRRDRKERELLVLLSKDKDKRIAQLLHQIALMSDIRSGSEALKIIRNS